MSDEVDFVVPDDLLPGVVAVAFTWDGEPFEYPYTWECAQTMANDGYKIVAVANDGAMEKEEIQRICDYENQMVFDCFGEQHKRYGEE